MMHLLHTRPFLITFIALLTCIPPASAQPQPAQQRSAESFERSGYDYLWSVIQDEFDHRSFKRPDDAQRYRQLIDIMIRTGSVYGQPFRDSSFGITDLYPKLLKLDPDPPLYVQYRYESSQAQNGSDSPDENYQQHAENLVRIAQEMDESGYPLYIRGATWIRAAEYFRDAGLENTDQAKLARTTGLDLIVDAASLLGIDPEYQEFVADRLSKFGWRYTALTDDDKDLYCERLLTSPDADPWIAHYAYGSLLHRRGWDARGTGWGRNVAPGDWRIFQQHLADAYPHLVRAWQLHPDWPEPATRLITLTMAQQFEPDRDEAFWFAQATGPRIDHQEAYTNLANALTARWGGSREQMFAFLDYVVDLSEREPNMGYIMLWVMSSITWSESDAHLVLHDEHYLGVVTQLIREEIERPLPYKGLWQRRRALRTVAMGNFSVHHEAVCAELLKAGGGMIDEPIYPWAEAGIFTQYATLLSTGRSDKVIEGMRANAKRDTQAAYKAFKQACRQIKREKLDPEIAGDPEKEVEKIVAGLKAKLPPSPYFNSTTSTIAAGAGVALLLGFLIVRRMRAAR